MKKEEVPQDKSNLSKSNIKELIYATDEKGEYTTALSSGWEPKTIALSQSIEEINERIAKAKEQVRNGQVSPICYYMELNKMDMPILASYVGMWQWRVKRHFDPKVFAGLGESTLKKYAEAVDITVDKLKDFKID